MFSPHRLFFAMLLLSGISFPASAGDKESKTCNQMPERLKTVTYSVADLIIPIENYTKIPVTDTAKSENRWITSPKDKAAPSSGTTEQALMSLIQNTVAVQTWSNKGGVGTIEYYPLGMAMVVNQTPAVQKQIANLLAELRQLQDQEISVEVRLVSVPNELMASILLNGLTTVPNVNNNAAAPKKDGSQQPTKAVIFNNAQALHLLEVVQGDTRANVMQMPKVTLCNGQAACLNIGDSQNFLTDMELCPQGNCAVFKPKVEAISTGIRMSLQSVVSADRRNIRVDLKSELANMDSADVPLFPVVIPVKSIDGEPVIFTQYIQRPRVNRLTCDTSLQVPDGHTALLYAGLQTREISSDPIPLLNDLPCVGSWLRETSKRYEAEHLLVMVTPRLIIQEEEEKKQPASIAVGEEECSCPVYESPAGKCKMEAEVKELLQRYQAACAAGQRQEATTLAVQALALDPTCFSTTHESKPGK